MRRAARGGVRSGAQRAGLVGLVVVGGGASVLTAGPTAGAQRAGDVVPGLGVIRELTGLGSPVAAAVVLALVWAAMLMHQRPRVATFVAVTGLGAGLLGAGTGAVVALAPPSATGPDRYVLSAAVAYGVLVLVVAPTLPARWRGSAAVAAVALVVLVGLTRLALDVPLPRVVLGGILGVSWLVVTTTAFGRPGPSPPLRAAAPRPGGTAAPWRRTGVLAGTWLLLLGLLVAVGTSVTRSPSVQRADGELTGWFVAIRTPALTTLAEGGSALGDTPTIVAGALALAVLGAAAVRSMRPVLLVVLVLGGELALFLVSGGIVDRPRPAVGHLGLLVPPTSSFPSGHVSAAVCLYGLAALLAARRVRPRLRWLPVAAAALVVASVTFGRLYFGVHHPSDVLASLLFAVPWSFVCRRLGPEPGAPTRR